jgi:hypothetical protein
MPAKIPEYDVELIVSNQSADLTPIDIEITVDERSIMREEFAPGSREMAQHAWSKVRVSLAKGKHRLMANSRKGKASLEKTFELPGVRSIMVAFWRADGPVSSRLVGKFTIQTSTGPPATM